MASGKDILSKAISHIGETGAPTWAWWNKNVQNWGTGWAWCCAFVNKVFVECGAGKLFYGGGKTASVGIADSWFYSHCKWVKYDEAQAGDIVIFTWYPTGAGNTRSGREKSHIGIWEKKLDASYFYAIEGNTGNSPAHVMRRKRSRNYIYAIYRPNYTSTPAPVKKAYSGVLPNATIKKGSRGTNVLRWQQFLYWWYSGLHNDMNKGGSFCDGIFGVKTQSYTMRFQKAQGIAVDGIVGKNTLAKAKAVRK